LAPGSVRGFQHDLSCKSSSSRKRRIFSSSGTSSFHAAGPRRCRGAANSAPGGPRPALARPAGRRCAKLIVTLAREADDHIGRDRNARNAGADPFRPGGGTDQRYSRGAYSASTWSSPACTGTSMCGHHFGQLGDRIQQFVGHPVGVRSQEADAFQSLDGVQTAQQPRSGWGMGSSLP
jgi:hypothetical protein